MMNWWVSFNFEKWWNDEMMGSFNFEKWWNDEMKVLLNDEMMKCWNKNDEQNSLNDEMMKWWNSVRNWNNNSTPILVGQTWTWQRVGGTSIPYRFVTVLVYNSLLIYAAQWIYCAQRTHRSSASRANRRNLTHVLAEWIHILLFNKLGSSKNSTE